MADQKRFESGVLICLYPLTLTPFYPPWKPNAAQKDVRVLSCIFLKIPPIAAPLLHHFGRKNSNRGIPFFSDYSFLSLRYLFFEETLTFLTVLRNLFCIFLSQFLLCSSMTSSKLQLASVFIFALSVSTNRNNLLF